MKSRIAALTALAACGAPSAALAERPAHAGGPAVVVTGVDVSDLELDGDRLAGSLSLDPISANKHARDVLRMSENGVRRSSEARMGRGGDKVVVRYVGLAAGDELQDTDVVQVIGKLTASGELDIRRIVVTRETPDEQPEPKPEPEPQGTPVEQPGEGTGEDGGAGAGEPTGTG